MFALDWAAQLVHRRPRIGVVAEMQVVRATAGGAARTPSEAAPPVEPATGDRDVISDCQFSVDLSAAVRAAVAAVALADDRVTDEERRVAIRMLRAFIADYDDTMFEIDLDGVGHVALEERLVALGAQLHPHGRERVLVAAAAVMAAGDPTSERTVAEVRRIGRALGMSHAHIEGVVTLHSPIP